MNISKMKTGQSKVIAAEEKGKVVKLVYVTKDWAKFNNELGKFLAKYDKNAMWDTKDASSNDLDWREHNK